MARLAIVTVAACYSPHPAAGGRCGTDDACPPTLVCSPASHTCEVSAIDAAEPRDAPHTDVDAPRIDAAVGPMLVQQAKLSSASAATLSVTLAAAPRNGSVLMMIGGDPVGSLTTVTGGGTTWTRAASSTDNANIELWYGVTDGSSSTITINIPNSSSPMTMHVSEWSGLAAANLLDIAGIGSGIAGPATASIVTTTARELLVFGVADGSPNTFGAPAPGSWTAMDGLAAPFSQLEWYRLQTVTGAVAPTVTATATGWDAVVAAFRIAP